jgi:hypothetical protein
MITVSQKSRMTQLLSKYIKSDVETKDLMRELEGMIDEKLNTEKCWLTDRKEKSLCTGWDRKTDETVQIIIVLISTLINLIVAFT